MSLVAEGELSGLKVGVTGASGFVGRQAVKALRAGGARVVGFSRCPDKAVEGCTEMRRFAPPQPPEGRDLDAVIHLAGENIFGFWSAEKKRRILQSRTEGTRAIALAAASGHFSGVVLSASAVGYFGNTGEEEKDEHSQAGRGFLAEVCQAWENALAPAQEAGCRVCIVRIGMVLGRGGGALKVMRPVFRLGLGGMLGNGRQWMSPVALEDVAGMFVWLLRRRELDGVFHATLPEPVRHGDFVRTLAKLLNRPAPWCMPAWCLRVMLGELAGLLLDSSRVVSRRALHEGWRLACPGLEQALARSLGG